MYGRKENDKFEDYQRDNATINYVSLDEVIEWIADNLQPEDVFSTDQMMKVVKELYAPEDVFDGGKLSEWAIENGYRQEEI